MAEKYLFAQGQAKPATEEDLIKDASGITYPNLHRRIDPELSPRFEYLPLMSAEGDYLLTTESEYMVAMVDINQLQSSTGSSLDTSPTMPNYDYVLLVQGLNSYRNTRYINVDEDNEVP